MNVSNVEEKKKSNLSQLSSSLEESWGSNDFKSTEVKDKTKIEKSKSKARESDEYEEDDFE